MSGTYGVQFDLGCHLIPPCAPEKVPFTIYIKTEDYCDNHTTYVNLLGKLGSFADSNYSVPSSVFSPNSKVYFLLEGLSYQAPILSVTCSNFTVRFIGTEQFDIFLYLNGVATSEGVSAGIKVLNSNEIGINSQSRIAFQLVTSLIPIDHNSFTTIIVTVDAYISQNGAQELYSWSTGALAPKSEYTSIYVPIPIPRATIYLLSIPINPSDSQSSTDTLASSSFRQFVSFPFLFFLASAALYLLLCLP